MTCSIFEVTIIKHMPTEHIVYIHKDLKYCTYCDFRVHKVTLHLHHYIYKNNITKVTDFIHNLYICYKTKHLNDIYNDNEIIYD